MFARIAAALLFALPSSAIAGSVVATVTIRAQEIVRPEAVRLDPMQIEGAHDSLDDVVGYEARVTIYPGRPVLRGALGEPALIDRNQIVELTYARAGLRIVAEGRALGRGAVGERIRVMNMTSRTTLFGTVLPDGTVTVTSE
ncbi:flagellar basal body P-ring formation chaperone FlgA [Salipiger sp.]|uniref:flagellar basal body P-ring formation chaperone FlgA n=1 Tax=Salipiger sp. TaxID=2078585 RepID=UPI003A9838B4